MTKTVSPAPGILDAVAGSGAAVFVRLPRRAPNSVRPGAPQDVAERPAGLLRCRCRCSGVSAEVSMEKRISASLPPIAQATACLQAGAAGQHSQCSRLNACGFPGDVSICVWCNWLATPHLEPEQDAGVAASVLRLQLHDVSARGQPRIVHCQSQESVSFPCRTCKSCKLAAGHAVLARQQADGRHTVCLHSAEVHASDLK